jgi:uncharacterized membrane protein YjgN (DUF898 family)
MLAMGKSRSFEFDGGAASYLGTGILAFLLTVCTLGLGLPWAIVMRHRWRARHTRIDGRRLAFVGSGASLFGHYIKWWFFMIITVGIYGFWLIPRLTKWTVENTDFDLAGVAVQGT